MELHALISLDIVGGEDGFRTAFYEYLNANNWTKLNEPETTWEVRFNKDQLTHSLVRKSLVSRMNQANNFATDRHPEGAPDKIVFALQIAPEPVYKNEIK